MLAKLRKDHENEEGFTLIELLVVVIIIGILAAIAIPAFLNQRERAWQAALTSDVRNVALDIEAEGTANGGRYPAAMTFDFELSDAALTDLAYYYSPLTAGATQGAAFCLLGNRDDINSGVNHVGYSTPEGGLVAYSNTGDETTTASCGTAPDQAWTAGTLTDEVP